MYIVVIRKHQTSSNHIGGGLSALIGNTSVQEFLTREQLEQWLVQNGATGTDTTIRVFEAKEMEHTLSVRLTEKGAKGMDYNSSPAYEYR